MTIYRPGVHNYAVGADVDVSQSMAAAALTAHSLYFDGASHVDCGNNASIINLHQANYTMDMYFLMPALDFGNYQTLTLLSNGSPQDEVDGWYYSVRSAILPQMRISSVQVKSSETLLHCNSPTVDCEEFYLLYTRFRRDINTIYYQWNLDQYTTWAGGVYGDDASEHHFIIGAQGALGSLSAFLRGYLCYVHIWDTDKGYLDSIPTSPFPIDDDTVARYRFSNGSGETLTDDSGNGNHGAISGAAWSDTIPSGWSL